MRQLLNLRVGARVLACGTAGLACLAVATAPAWADGSQTISGAPTVAFGQQEFGNTSSGTQDSDGYFHSYWALPVIAGDSVTIDWEAPNYASGQYPTLRIFPVGTTDYNVGTTETSQYQDLSDNGRNELQFTAPRSGTMPVDFRSSCASCDGGAGPYEFTAAVRHRVLLAVPAKHSLPLHGTVAVTVRDPDGSGVSDAALRISLQVRTAHGAWRAVGAAAPAGGTARIRYVLPSADAGLHLRLRALATGSQYTAATSSLQVVSVPAKRKAGARRG